MRKSLGRHAIRFVTIKKALQAQADPGNGGVIRGGPFVMFM